MKREDDSDALQDFEFKYSLQVFKIYISYSVPDDEGEKKLFIRDEELSLLSETQELEIYFISIFL